MKRIKLDFNPKCACGCGKLVRPCKGRPGWYPAGLYLVGHFMRGRAKTPGQVAKMRAANLGSKRSAAAVAAMKRARHPEGLSMIEQAFVEEMTEQGWSVIKDGWPDFLMERCGHFRLVELERERATGKDLLTPRQRRMHAALTRAGLTVEVVHRGR